MHSGAHATQPHQHWTLCECVTVCLAQLAGVLPAAGYLKFSTFFVRRRCAAASCNSHRSFCHFILVLYDFLRRVNISVCRRDGRSFFLSLFVCRSRRWDTRIAHIQRAYSYCFFSFFLDNSIAFSELCKMILNNVRLSSFSVSLPLCSLDIHDVDSFSSHELSSTEGGMSQIFDWCEHEPNTREWIRYVADILLSMQFAFVAHTQYIT